MNSYKTTTNDYGDDVDGIHDEDDDDDDNGDVDDDDQDDDKIYCIIILLMEFRMCTNPPHEQWIGEEKSCDFRYGDLFLHDALQFMKIPLK